MKNRKLIEKTERFVRSQLAAAEGGHAWSHIERVRNNAFAIREEEGKGDLLIIELAVLLHDIADSKFHDGPETKGGDIAHRFLLDQGAETEKADHIREIIDHLSFKHTFKNNLPRPEDGNPASKPGDTPNRSIEFMIVQDADRLDALGAIGIARAFNYGGFKNRLLYDPAITPREYTSIEEYKQSAAPTINHFYEKLFTLKDLMNTDAGRQMAQERHDYMVQFVDRFKSEWRGRL
jgi:uncharacterized protein